MGIFRFFFHNLISPTNIGPKSSIENALKQMHGLKKINFLCPKNYLSTEELCRNFAKLTLEALLWFWDIATDLLIYVYNSLKKSCICKKSKKGKQEKCYVFILWQNKTYALKYAYHLSAPVFEQKILTMHLFK